MSKHHENMNSDPIWNIYSTFTALTALKARVELRTKFLVARITFELVCCRDDTAMKWTIPWDTCQPRCPSFVRRDVVKFPFGFQCHKNAFRYIQSMSNWCSTTHNNNKSFITFTTHKQVINPSRCTWKCKL